MNAVVLPSELKGSVRAPASKSLAHRILICAFLSGRKVRIDGRIQGDDVTATAECLSLLAKEIYRNDTLNEVLGMLRRVSGDYSLTEFASPYMKKEGKDQRDPKGKPTFSDSYKIGGSYGIPVLNVGESGSTFRFLLPVVCALGISVRFTGRGRLSERPVTELMDVLRRHGAEFEDGGQAEKLPFVCKGKLESGVYEITGNVSSQYISGLLFALPLLSGDSEIVIAGESVSESYVKLTLSVLKEFGICVTRTGRGFYVKGGQKYEAPLSAEAEGDWSSAGFMLAAGVLSGDVTVTGLNTASDQGDKIVAELLINAGADLTFNKDCVRAKKSELHSISYSAKDCPDTVPVMAVALARAEGISRISGVDRLRTKESDRLDAVINMLNGFGVRTQYADDVLTIFGKGGFCASDERGYGESKVCGSKENERNSAEDTKKNVVRNFGLLNHNVFSGYADHRIAMSSIVGAIAADGESLVLGTECIAKSYPDFIKDMNLLGGKIIEK